MNFKKQSDKLRKEIEDFGQFMAIFDNYFAS